MLIENLPLKTCLDPANLHNNLAGICKENGSYRRAITHYELAETSLEVTLTYHELGLNISSISLLERAKNIYSINHLSRKDRRCIQLQEAFDACR